VGPRTGLRGPPKVVMALGNHDDHLHVRIRPPRPPLTAVADDATVPDRAVTRR
jgi:hypothetical protein